MTEDARRLLRELPEKWRIEAEDAKARGYLETWNTLVSSAFQLDDLLSRIDPSPQEWPVHESWWAADDALERARQEKLSAENTALRDALTALADKYPDLKLVVPTFAEEFAALTAHAPQEKKP